jgi:ADP-ribosyl-[dinitrogen reductase] hydrolase
MLTIMIAQGRLRLPPGALAALAAPPLLGPVPFDRVEGMLLGLAIGDSLGNTTEGQLPSSRRDIRYYEPNRYAGCRAVGVPSGCRGGFQTRPYTLWTLEHLLEHDRIVPEQLLATFPSRRIFGIGHTVAGTSIGVLPLKSEPQYPAHAWPNVYLQFLNSGTRHLPIEFAVACGTRLQKSAVN